jgi:hypothetical protein
MEQVADLCYETLHRPFGVARDDDWDNLDPFSRHLVALDGERVVGYGRLIQESDWAHLRQVVVDEAYRGRGIGGALVNELVDEASRRRLRRAYLNARLPAVQLYRRAGFSVVGEQFAMARTYVQHVRMERRVV